MFAPYSICRYWCSCFRTSFLALVQCTLPMKNKDTGLSISSQTRATTSATPTSCVSDILPYPIFSTGHPPPMLFVEVKLTEVDVRVSEDGRADDETMTSTLAWLAILSLFLLPRRRVRQHCALTKRCSAFSRPHPAVLRLIVSPSATKRYFYKRFAARPFSKRKAKTLDEVIMFEWLKR